MCITNVLLVICIIDILLAVCISTALLAVCMHIKKCQTEPFKKHAEMCLRIRGNEVINDNN